MVIAMRNMFVKGELPGETRSTSAGSDISSFTELHQDAMDVYAQCSNPEVNKPGWYPAGRPLTSFVFQPGTGFSLRLLVGWMVRFTDDG